MSVTAGSEPSKRVPFIVPAVLMLAVLALAGLVLAACARQEPAPAGEARIYQARGLVRQLPSGPGRELMIHHEAIPDLVDDRGEVVGMDAMTMGFPVADPALLEGVAVGDKIAFELRLDWQGSPALAITRLEVLPADVRLEFE